MTHNTPAPIADPALAERLARLLDYAGRSPSDAIRYVQASSDAHRSSQLITLAEAQAMVAAEVDALAKTISAYAATARSNDEIARESAFETCVEAILAAADKPQTEYERKVAQMKEDFPNGI